MERLTAAVSRLEHLLGFPLTPEAEQKDLEQKEPELKKLEQLDQQQAWQEMGVRKLRPLLRSYQFDRSSLPASINSLRRVQLIEALRQVSALQ